MERRFGRKEDEWAFLRGMIHGADVIIEVVDARDVEGTRLPAAERMAGSRRLLMVANKKDLLPRGSRPPRLQNRGLYINAKLQSEGQRQGLIRAIMARTEARPVRALLIGYPNVGKSTLINMLAHRNAAKVSPVAGTTKDIQWVSIIPGLMVSDYRGLFPKREPRGELVRKGAMDVRGDEEAHAHPFAERVLRSAVLRAWLQEKLDVGLQDAKTSEHVLAAIARRRKLFLKGGGLNLEEAARILVRAMREAPEI